MWEPFPMTPTSTRRKIGIGISYFIDFIICVAVLLWVALVELGVTPHYQQGFFCNDTSIGYKFKGDTVTVTCLVISFFIPILLMWITETTNLHNASTANTSLTSSMKSGIVDCSGYIKGYSIGILGKLVIVETLKTMLGELRPHFLDTCKPDALKDCADGLTYIKEYKCTGYSEFGTILVTDSSRSFPSGHASISFFQAIFMIWYFQVKFPKNNRSQLLLPFIQCLCACWACFCGASRITDHRHHWWDVLAGGLFGVVFSVFTCAVFCKRFKKIISSPAEVPNQNGTTTNNHHNHTSIKRLISDSSIKEEVTLNNVTIT